MACHEIAALRLALMTVLGRDDAAERQHELAELGDAAERPGPIRALAQAGDLAGVGRAFDAAIAALEERVATTGDTDPALPYLRTLLVLNRKVELELRHQVEALAHLYRDLEAMHDFVHELYPAGD
ncbi:MAG TPA: DUF3209 family protein [Kofleriaceae bacterium]|jgi:hypothetical protein|nr:DUF3209 family protein [Kofleriaceae bacterium]